MIISQKGWDIDVVGVLVSDEYTAELTGRQAAFVNSQNSLQFAIRIISQVPYGFPSDELFWAYTSDLERFGFEDDLDLDRNSRVEILREFLFNKLFIFTPYRKQRPEGAVFQTRDFRIVTAPTGYLEESQYVPVPIFSEKNMLKYENFISRLWLKQPVGRIQRISTDSSDTPPYVLWKNNNDSFQVIGDFSKHLYRSVGGFTLFFEEMKIVDFDEAWFKNSFTHKDIMFVEENYYRQIGQKINNATPEMKPDSNDIPRVEPVFEPEEEEQEEDNPSNLGVGKNDVIQTEEDLIQHFIQCTRDHGLMYDEKDLINFHTAMKSSNLVILAGMSGTGKSRLCTAYADALGLTSETNQMTVIPVRPSWTDDADLIGYVDSIHNVYRPGDSGLINTLIQASLDKNENKLYMVLFDEMNLARVEHYFSQFLSVLEMPISRRELKLYNKELESRLHNSIVYPSTIPIRENVLFVGTANLDETTHHFSDKVLDRSNVIKLKINSFVNLLDLREKRQNHKSVSFTLYQQFKDQSTQVRLLEEELNFFDELHKAIQDINEESGIGYRIIRQIDTYLRNLPKETTLTRDEALDLQVLQRIMTKLRGSEEQMKPLIGEFENNLVLSSTLQDVLNKYHGVSSFQKTRRALVHKAKELRLHGYTV